MVIVMACKKVNYGQKKRSTTERRRKFFPPFRTIDRQSNIHQKSRVVQNYWDTD